MKRLLLNQYTNSQINVTSRTFSRGFVRKTWLYSDGTDSTLQRWFRISRYFVFERLGNRFYCLELWKNVWQSFVRFTCPEKRFPWIENNDSFISDIWKIWTINEFQNNVFISVFQFSTYTTRGFVEKWGEGIYSIFTNPTTTSSRKILFLHFHISILMKSFRTEVWKHQNRNEVNLVNKVLDQLCNIKINYSNVIF